MPPRITPPTSGRSSGRAREPLTPNWKHLPIGYHGRAGTVVVSGTPIRRPCGQSRLARRRRRSSAPPPGSTSRPNSASSSARTATWATRYRSSGSPSTSSASAWSTTGRRATSRPGSTCRSGRSSASPSPPRSRPGYCRWPRWITRASGRRRATPSVLGYLTETADWGLDIDFEVRLNGHLITRPPYASMYWSPAQMLAHMTVNGAALRSGDLFASGTVSGPEPRQRGSLIELAWNGSNPVSLPDGSFRSWLHGRGRGHDHCRRARSGRCPDRARVSDRLQSCQQSLSQPKGTTSAAPVATGYRRSRTLVRRRPGWSASQQEPVSDTTMHESPEGGRMQLCRGQRSRGTSPRTRGRTLWTSRASTWLDWPTTFAV